MKTLHIRLSLPYLIMGTAYNKVFQISREKFERGLGSIHGPRGRGSNVSLEI